MKRNQSRACALTLGILAGVLSGAVLASDIYKWTDENGIVHYVDRPSGAASEEVIVLSSNPTDPERVQARVESRADSSAALTNDEAAAAKQEPTEEELRAKARERAEKCTMYKERLQNFVTSRRLYREDESGERVYLDEEEMRAARAKVQGQVVEFCN